MLKIAYHPIYKHPLPEGHRFPMAKYELLPEQLLHEGTCTEAHFFEPEIPNDKFILAVHDPEYYYDLVNITLDQRAARKIGFPLSETLVEREVIIADGSMKAAVYALKHGIAMNIAGGTHHAYTNRGEAFCLLNVTKDQMSCFCRAYVTWYRYTLSYSQKWPMLLLCSCSCSCSCLRLFSCTHTQFYF